MKNVAVFGTGQAALSLAVHFIKLGMEVYLYRDNQHLGCLKYLSDDQITVNGINAGSYRFNNITENLELIFTKCELIFIVAPTFAHQRIYQLISYYVFARHYIYNVTANFSSLFVDNYTGKKGLNISDISLFPFACRFEKNGVLTNLGLKRELHLASLNSKKTTDSISKINKIFPSKLIASENVFEVGLRNVNGICHPAIMILNAGRIGNGNELFYFNKEGVNENISFVLENLETERCQIAETMGFKIDTFLKTMDRFYGEYFLSINDFFKNSQVLNQSKLCPGKIGGRYFDEDVGYLLVAWKSLADYCSVKAGTIDSLIHLASVLNQKDYYKFGRSISKEKFNIGLHPAFMDCTL